MNRQILGIHHITAIASDPQANIDFYTGVLGLRLVKVTVNFDDPSTYHLYYGDGVGHPGTIITFFPWPSAPRGRRGTAQVTETAFAVPENSLGYWVARLAERKISFRGPFERLGEEVVSFLDPDGLGIEIVSSRIVNNDRAYQAGPIPLQYGIHGFHSATLFEKDLASTAALLAETMGFTLVGQDGDRFRYRTDASEVANVVDVIHAPKERTGRVLVPPIQSEAPTTIKFQRQRSIFCRLPLRESPPPSGRRKQVAEFRRPERFCAVDGLTRG